MARPLVVLGLLGTTLDQGRGPDRWDRWRPTVDLARHETLAIDRLELLHPARAHSIARTVAEDVVRLSPRTTVRQHTFELRDPWDLQEVYGALHDFARAYPFRPDDEDYLVHITTGSHIAQISLFLLTESRFFPARLLQTSPPKGGVKGRGEGRYELIDLDLASYDRLAARFEQERSGRVSVLKRGIETKSPAFNALIDRLERVAGDTTDPLLLHGATGSGKSELARQLFALKKERQRLRGDFVEVNCATLRGDGAMSALFGHVKGAYTGAATAREGLLRRADGGVLFLDELGELGADEQAMLLRAVEEKRFLPVGSDREVSSDFQLLAGTNRDLTVEVAAGRFREDLHARLRLWSFRLPSLRERPEDLEPNLDFELERCARAMNLRVTLSREARQSFLSFATSKAARWPGNFRDLGAAVRRMATLARGGRISEADVEEELARLRESWDGPAPAASLVTRALGAEAAEALDRFDRVQLQDVLQVVQEAESLSAAGRELFSASRAQRTSTNDADRLRKYLARFGLSFQALRGG